jgi:hypothetical protein
MDTPDQAAHRQSEDRNKEEQERCSVTKLPHVFRWSPNIALVPLCFDLRSDGAPPDPAYPLFFLAC